MGNPQSSPYKGRRLVAEGFQFHLPGQDFDPNYPFTYCRLCGEVYQTPQSRSQLPNDVIESADQRRRWSHTHQAMRHTQHQVDELENSGLWLTPEAQHKLAPVGVIALSDFRISEEHHVAGKESARYREDLT